MQQVQTHEEHEVEGEEQLELNLSDGSEDEEVMSARVTRMVKVAGMVKRRHCQTLKPL